MANDFEGRHVLITGGTRGIGLALAIRLAGEGARLSLNYLSREADAEQAISEVQAAGGQAVAIRGEVSQPDVSRLRHAPRGGQSICWFTPLEQAFQCMPVT